MIERGATGIRQTLRQTLPRHAAVASWKHASASYVEHADIELTPKDRGAEQGDVDGPLECSVALAQVARETRTNIAGLQWSAALDGFEWDQRRGRKR